MKKLSKKESKKVNGGATMSGNVIRDASLRQEVKKEQDYVSRSGGNPSMLSYGFRNEGNQVWTPRGWQNTTPSPTFSSSARRN